MNGRKLKASLALMLSLSLVMSAASESPKPGATPLPVSSPGGNGRWMTDEELQAFGEECVAEAAPDIVKEATTDLRIENAGLKAENSVLTSQREAAQEEAKAERKRARNLEVGGIVAAWVAAVLFVADFILGWWRFGA